MFECIYHVETYQIIYRRVQPIKVLLPKNKISTYTTPMWKRLSNHHRTQKMLDFMFWYRVVLVHQCFINLVFIVVVISQSSLLSVYKKLIKDPLYQLSTKQYLFWLHYLHSSFLLFYRCVVGLCCNMFVLYNILLKCFQIIHKRNCNAASTGKY